VFGSRWLVASAVAVATALGLSQLLIGLTIVAAGTSLPEVATSIVAAVRGERDIAVGNAVGSSIFNLVAVLGVSAAVAPDGLAVAPSAVNFDIPVMIAVAVACLPIFFTGHEISRWEGGLFLGYYVAYTAYLVLAATDHDALPEFSGVLVLFALPITVVTLLLTTARAAERRRRRRN
jgi:cation:H+ antiporter